MKEQVIFQYSIIVLLSRYLTKQKKMLPIEDLIKHKF